MGLKSKPASKPPAPKIEPPKLPSMAGGAKKPNLFNDNDDDDDEDVGFRLPSKAAPPKLAMPAPQIAPPKVAAKPQMFNNDYDDEDDTDFQPKKVNAKPLAMP